VRASVVRPALTPILPPSPMMMENGPENAVGVERASYLRYI
jgi:hypothetical protein